MNVLGGSHGTVTGETGLMKLPGITSVGMVSRVGLKARRARIAYLLIAKGYKIGEIEKNRVM
jgi:hypothetical protein